MKREHWAPVAAVAAVLAVVGAVSLLGRGTTEPPVLRLAGGAASDTALGASSSESRSAGFRVVGSLPDGPAEARVRDLPEGAASEKRVLALAAALGVDGSPARADRGWRLADLVVSDGPGNPWTWNGCGPDIAVAPDTPVSSDDGVTTSSTTCVSGYGVAVCDAASPECAAGDCATSSDGTTTCSGGGSSGSTPGSGGSGSGSSDPGCLSTLLASPSPSVTCGTAVPPEPADPPAQASDQPGVASDTPAVPPSCLRDAACSGPPEICPPATKGAVTAGGSAGAPAAGTEPALGAPEVDCPYLPVPLPVETPPGPKPAPPSVLPSAALAAAEPVLGALGLNDAATRVEGLSVVAEPVVAGLPTSGFSTVLQLSAKVAVVGGSGWLSDGRDGASYPLRSATDALAALPVLAMGAPCDVVKGCPPEPAITGARLGLARTDLTDGEAALVPAWLYTVEGSPVPLVALAVQGRFLGDPGQTEPGGGTEPGGSEPGGGTEPGGSDPGQVEPPPPPVEPAPGAPGTPAEPAPGGPGSEPSTMPAFYAVADGGLTLTTEFARGVCPDEDWDLRAEESAEQVVLSVVVPDPAPGACRALAKLQPDSVRLKAPLGDREVVDAKGRPVPHGSATP